MQVKTIRQNLDLKLLSGKNLDCEISAAYCSDVLSDVMSKAKKNYLWITNQNHENVLAIAFFKELSCIILTSGIIPKDDVLHKAIEKNITLLSTDLTAFEISGELYKLGIKGKV